MTAPRRTAKKKPARARKTARPEKAAARSAATGAKAKRKPPASARGDAASGLAGAAHAVEALGEDDASFAVRAGGAYVANGWESTPYVGELRPFDTGEVKLGVPPGWGTPRVEGAGRVWSLPGAEVTLSIEDAPRVLAGAREWIDLRRASAIDGWLVIAGREVEHEQGLGVETCELHEVAPRFVRASRYLFVPPRVAVLTLLCPDVVPDARGSELVTAFRSLRVRP